MLFTFYHRYFPFLQNLEEKNHLEPHSPMSEFESLPYPPLLTCVILPSLLGEDFNEGVRCLEEKEKG